MNFLELYSCSILLLGQLVMYLKADTNMENVKAIWSRYAEVTKGDSTYYGVYPGGGACALDPPSPLNKQPNWIMVAAGKDDYQKSLGCGMCVEIKGNGTSTTPATGGPSPMKGPYLAYVGDLCGGCKQAGFDLYIDGYGKWKTEFKAIECPNVPGKEGNIQFRFTGSNPWSIKLQARNSKVVTAGMEILNNGEWICMTRTDDNYFTINGLGEMKFPKRFRVTSISNEQLESELPDIKNDENIPSDIQYSGFKPDSKPEDIKCYGQGGRKEPASPTTTTSSSSTPTPAGGSTTPAGSTPPTPGGTTSGSTSMLPSSPTPKPTTPGASVTPTPGSSTPTSGGTSPTPSAAPSTAGSAGTIGTPTAPSSAVPPSRPSQEDKNFCKGKATGYYPDPNDCNSFYHCANGMTNWKHCPEGLYFNPAVKVCDWPRNVKCQSKGEDDASKKPPELRFIQIAKKSKQNRVGSASVE